MARARFVDLGNWRNITHPASGSRYAVSLVICCDGGRATACSAEAGFLRSIDFRGECQTTTQGQVPYENDISDNERSRNLCAAARGGRGARGHIRLRPHARLFATEDLLPQGFNQV